jgi:hypothetical protein
VVTPQSQSETWVACTVLQRLVPLPGQVPPPGSFRPWRPLVTRRLRRQPRPPALSSLSLSPLTVGGSIECLGGGTRLN